MHLTMMGGKMIKNGVGLNGLPLDESRRNRLCQGGRICFKVKDLKEKGKEVKRF